MRKLTSSIPNNIPLIVTKPVKNEVYPPITDKDKNDHARLRQGRERHEGFEIGKFVQSIPMFFSRDGHNIWTGDTYKGSSAFLILGGPSFGELLKSDNVKIGDQFLSPIEALKYPGFITMSVNNSPKTFRTNLWTCVDDPTHFIKSIWLDPKITKYVPFCHAEKTIFDNEKWEMSNIKVGDCPNVTFYRRNEHFQAKQFLTEDTINWGDHKNTGGGRSVMLAAIRILFHLGIRNIFLLGCDFNMDDNNKYHFDQDRTKASQQGNNNTYSILKDRFEELKPIFEQYGLNVYNCNSKSGLKTFPFITFEKAIQKATQTIPNIITEKTNGLYDREAKAKIKEPKPVAIPGVVVPDREYTDTEKRDIKEKLDQSRFDLAASKLNLQSAKEKGNAELVKQFENEVMSNRKKFRALEVTKNIIWGIKK